MNEKPYYTITDLEELLGISRPTVYKLVKEKFFYSVLIGRRYFISKSSFDAWFYGTDSEEYEE